MTRRRELAAAFVALTRERWVEDPWGLGFRFLIRSDRDDAYQDWLGTFEKGTMKAVFTQIGSRLGVRMVVAELGKKRTKAEKKKFEEKLFEQICAEAAERLDDLGEGPDLNAKKEGLVRFLLRGWRGLEPWRQLDPDFDAEFSVRSALRLLGWKGVVVTPQGGEPTFHSGAGEARLAELRKEGEVEVFGGHPDSPCGGKIRVQFGAEEGGDLGDGDEPQEEELDEPEEYYQGWLAGDALAHFLLGQCGKLTAFAATAEARASEDLGPTSGGSTSTGSTAASTNGGE